MNNSIHLICKKLANGQPMNVSHIEGTKNFISGYWDIRDHEADALIGGWIYLHIAKANKSYYGGRTSNFRHEIRNDVARQDRIGLIFRPALTAREIAWRGQHHDRAWTGGLVDAKLPHEVEVSIT